MRSGVDEHRAVPDPLVIRRLGCIGLVGCCATPLDVAIEPPLAIFPLHHSYPVVFASVAHDADTLVRLTVEVMHIVGAHALDSHAMQDSGDVQPQNFGVVRFIH